MKLWSKILKLSRLFFICFILLLLVTFFNVFFNISNELYWWFMSIEKVFMLKFNLVTIESIYRNVKLNLLL